MRIRMLAAAALLAAASLTGCVTSGGCPGWHWYDSPQDMYDGARRVLVGTVEPTGATRDVYGAAGAVYRVAVDELLKGEDAPTEVVSTPESCNGDAGPYPDGDPLDVEGTVILFLTRIDGGGWRTLTPLQGVLPLPEDGMLPFEVEDR